MVEQKTIRPLKEGTMTEETPKADHRSREEDTGAPLIKRGAQSRLPLKAAIIGGGKACDNLLALLGDDRLNRLNMDILGVADPNPDSPGIRHAQDLGIFTTGDFTELYPLPGLNLLIELTGSTNVRERMIRTKPLQISSIDHRGARLLWDLLQIETEKQHLQNESEKAIRRERDWWQKVIDSLPDRIMVLNKDHTIHRVNKTFVKETGLKEQNVLGKLCHDIAVSISLVCGGEQNNCPLEKVFSMGESYLGIHEHRDADEKTIYEEITGTPILDEKGEIVQVIEGFRDVTRRVMLERELRESEEKLRQFLESAHDTICIKDLDGRYLYVNPAAAKYMGISRDEAIGQTDFEIFPERLAQAMAAHDREVFSQHKTLYFKEKMRIKGQIHHFHTVRFPILNDQGEMASFAIIARDMSDEVALQEEVRQNKEYLENILVNSSDMIITTDLQGNIVTYNPGAERMLGYSNEKILNTSVEKLWKDPEERRELMAEVEARGSVDNYPATLVAKGGHEVEVSLSLSQLRDSDGRVLGTVGTSKDITEENRLRGKLIEQERLAAVGQTVAGVTHCMKNVLNGLKGGAYMVNVGIKRNDSALLDEGWQNVQKGIGRISKLSLDMLSYCRERRPMLVPTDPLELIRESVEIISKSAKQDGIKILCHGDDGPSVNLDQEALGRALLNLISNAIDACKEKSYGEGEMPQVEITVERKKDRVIFVVRDNGVGMNDEICSQLFTRFFSTKESHGTGLGLCVTHKIVDEHGGEMGVDSNPGQGSTFTIRLPDNPAQESACDTSKQ